MAKSLRVQALEVYTPQRAQACATLSSDGTDFSFAYHPGVPEAAAVSLAMVVRPLPYPNAARLHPIFEMNLPEGRILEVIKHQLAKAGVLDPMLMLAVTGRAAPIGRVRVNAPEIDLPTASEEPVGLSEILKWKGAGALYAELEKRYALRSGLSGVQPKVLVPQRDEGERKATLPLPDLIVKAGSPEYPHLAINEFVCLSIAKEANIDVPEFHLSDDRQLLVVQRFDRAKDGSALGFEDMCVAMRRSAEHKYAGSYAQLARAVTAYSAHRAEDLRRLFRMVALSCIVGNGDAHLKNFGLLYESPDQAARLAPAYDIVCTRAYIPEDELALTLGGQRSFHAAKLGLLDLAKICEVDAFAEVEQILAAAEHTQKKMAGLLEDCPQIRDGLEAGQQMFQKAFVDQRRAELARPASRA